MSLYISNSGSNQNNGTKNKPFKTLDYALNNITNETNIIFLTGSYEIPTTTISIDNLTIKSENNNKVIIDGTKDINDLKEENSNWIKLNHIVSSENGNSIKNINIYRIKLKPDVKIWQLFCNKKEIMNARYPSAQWDNDEVFDNTNNWGHGYYHVNTNGSINYVNGEIIDYSTNKIDLYNYVKNIRLNIDNNFDLSGVIANLNVGSYKTFTKVINNMVLDDINKYIKLIYNPVDLWKVKHHYYYLENNLQFLNSENEYYYDSSDNFLYVRLFNDINPNNVEIRSKVQTYCLYLNNHNIKIDNLNFFATTFKADKNNININNCNFLYPSCYARTINKINYTNDNDVFDNTTLIKSGTNCIINKCCFRYTDGIALEMWGDNNTLQDCYFSYIDKTVANLSSVMTTVRLNGSNNLVKNNTFYKTGASSTLNSGNEAIIEYNNLSESGFLQSDGALIHVMVNQQPNVKIRFNWCHDSIKYGIRFDGEGEGHTGYIHHNIVWNCEGGIMIKGGKLNDNNKTVGGHFVYNNTVFNSLENGKNDIMALNVQGKDENNIPIPINFGSIIMNNLAENIYGHRSNNVEISSNMFNSNNFMPNNLEDFINSFNNRDFRPLNNINIINQSDISSINANTYVSSLDSFNSDPTLSFNPVNDDKLTKDIGAMNIDDIIWRAGITWNNLLLKENELDIYILNNLFNFYPSNDVKNNTYFDKELLKQQRRSTINNYYKKIYLKNILFTNNTKNGNESSRSSYDGTNDRLLRLKTKAIIS